MKELAGMLLFFALFGVAVVVLFSPLWVPFAIRGARLRRRRRDALVAAGGTVRRGAVVFRVRDHEVVVRPDHPLSFTVVGLTPEVRASIYLYPMSADPYRRRQRLTNGPWLSEAMYATVRPHIGVAALGTAATEHRQRERAALPSMPLDTASDRLKALLLEKNVGLEPLHAFSFSPAQTRALLDDDEVAAALSSCPSLGWASFRSGTLRVVIHIDLKEDITPKAPAMLASITKIIDAVDRTRGERLQRLRARAS